MGLFHRSPSAQDPVTLRRSLARAVARQQQLEEQQGECYKALQDAASADARRRTAPKARQELEWLLGVLGPGGETDPDLPQALRLRIGHLRAHLHGLDADPRILSADERVELSERLRVLDTERSELSRELADLRDALERAKATRQNTEGW